MTNRSLFLFGLPALVAVIPCFAQLPMPDADNGGIHLPPGFRALVVADRLVADRKIGKTADNLRFLTVAQNGDLYAKSYHGGIFALRDKDGDGRFDEVHEFAAGPGSDGTAVMLHEGWLYYSTRTGVYRYKYTPGVLIPTGEPETIVAELPAEKDHDAKSFAFDGDGRLLVEVGSPYNVYSQNDRRYGATGKDATEFLKTHGGYWRFDPNRQNQTLADGFHFSTGHRHSLAIAWHPIRHAFFMAQMGRDQLNAVDPLHYDELDNAERVSEEFHLLREGTNLGWPYTYWDPFKQARMVAPEFGGDGQKRSDNPAFDKPLIAFPGHWAPLQMVVYSATQFPAHYQNGIFIAFHGSWNRAPLPQQGYNVSFIPFDKSGVPLGTYEVFAHGFPQKDKFTNTREARYQPGGLAVGPDGSLFVSDTKVGRIWRIIYTGETVDTHNGSQNAIDPAPVRLGEGDHPGRKVYTQYCAGCHMLDGSGVMNMQPSLIESQVVAGDPERLIKVILRGPASVLPPDRPKFSNVMPAFNTLTDDQIADLLTYLRQPSGAAEINAHSVSVLRTSLH